MKHLVVIGDATIDTQIMIDNASVECDVDHSRCRLCLDYAAKVPVRESYQTVGGDGANVAVGATKLGLQTALLADVGTDSNGQIILDTIKKAGVDISLVSKSKKPPTRYSVILNFQGERTILSQHGKRDYVWPKNFPPTDWIYLTGLSEGLKPLHETLLKYIAKHATVRLAYTPGSHQLKHNVADIRALLPAVDTLIINLEEAEIILGTTLKKEKSTTALIHELLKLGPDEVVITDAARGAYAGNIDDVYHLASFPVKVVAKTGAGDAFSAGYIAAKINGHSPQVALQWGIANSCGVISAVGAQAGLLNRKELEKMIKKYSDIKPKKIN
ncbi:MAG: hypothetical protein A3J93_02785 [Candidatus Magasanikbacteria bacterium RIFOXYC2_FULL_42_28]|uniref:Carbohydrate kinase PfkB domain-containing protein n=1 Tax=Candidatus Magasanikbacteria bacterium RIFOXYC2_FULL_42_28 TaxID=1798704 RepID=A0A1F6NUW8_9BACT|nr:MAG: hypothetical protein A3J93_02785 [Candidatus Magasanikbacteria bacterium RIFOXYC2_FULL_42_28]